MNLKQLGFVRAVSQTSSFSRAADACCVAQPTLSKGIAQLEDELGGRLFERTTRKVELTAFGRHVLPLISGVLEAKEELSKGASAYLNPEHKLLRIGLSPLINVRLLTTILEPFKRDHEDVDCLFKECYLKTQVERLNHEGIDIALRPRQSFVPHDVAHDSCTFYRDDLYFLPKSVTQAQAPAAGPVSLDAIAEETFVLTGDGCGLAAVTRDLFAAHGLKVSEYPGVALSYQMLQDWAEVGIGAALLPLSKISPENHGRARPLLLGSGEPARVVYEALWKSNADYPPHLRELHDYFRNAVPQLVRGLAA